MPLGVAATPAAVAAVARAGDEPVESADATSVHDGTGAETS
jgi:hypothetical protein